MRTLLAINDNKEVVLKSDLDNDEDAKIFGDFYLSDEMEEYAIDEVGPDFELLIEDI